MVKALKKNNMQRKAKGKGYKMNGHTLPGINQRMDKSSNPDGRAKSSMFQNKPSGGKTTPPTVEEQIAAADAKYGDEGINVKYKDSSRDIIARKIGYNRSGVVNPDMKQSVRRKNYAEADEVLANKGDRDAKQRLIDRKANIKKVKQKQEELGRQLTTEETNRIMSGN